MYRSQPPTWSKIAGIAVPVTGGGSWLISLAGIPKATAIIVAAALLASASIAAAVATALPRIIESIQKRKASTLKAKAEVIKAESEAKSLDRRTKTENKITKMGMKSAEKANLAERMLDARALSPDRPEGRRLPDIIVDRHMPMPRVKFTAEELRSPPEGPSSSPEAGGSSTDGGGAAPGGASASGVVVPRSGHAMPRSDVSTGLADLLHQP